MRRIIRIIVIICLLIVLASIFVYGSDGTDGSESGGAYNSIYDNYYLDMEPKSMMKAPVANLFNALANGLFGLIKMLGNFVCSLTEFAYSVNMFELMEDTMTPLFGNIGSKIFGGLSIFFIGLAGFYLIFKLARGHLINVILGILSLALVIAIATAFFTYPGRILTSVDEAFSDIAGDIIDPVYQDINGSDAENVSSAKKTSDLLWNIIVHKPWQILEFGSESVADKHEEKILALEEGSDEREEYVKEANVKTFKATVSQQVERFSTVIIYLIFSVIVFVAVLAFLVLIIGYQLWVWVLAIFSIFVFLMALVPNFGLGLLKRWAVQILSAMAIKVVLSFMLIILFVVMSFFYGLTGKFTMFEVMFMFISMFFIAYKKRGDLVKLFAVSVHVPGSEFINRNNAERLREGAQDVNRRLDNRITGWIVRRRYGTPNEEESYEQGGSVSKNQKDQEVNRSSYINKTNYEKNPTGEYKTRKVYEGRYRENANAERDKRAYEEEQNADYTSKDEAYRSVEFYDRTEKQRGEDYEPSDANFRKNYEEVYSQNDKNKAIEILRYNYEESKRLAEEKALKSGKEVEYTEFVRRTDALRAMNKNAEFDTRDVEKVARIVKRYEAAGGNADELKGKDFNNKNLTKTTIKRPRNLLDFKEKQKKTEIKKQPKGLEFFRQNFGEEKGENFYNKLSEKYGEEQLNQFTSNDKLSYSQVNHQLRHVKRDRQ